MCLQSDGVSAYPGRALIGVYGTPWGVETTTVVRFETLPQAGAWTFHYPVNPNTTVLSATVVYAESCGQVCAHESEVTVGGIRPRHRDLGLTVVMVSAQPMSFKMLFMKWIHLGSRANPCNVSFHFDLSECPPSLLSDMQVDIRAYQKDGQSRRYKYLGSRITLERKFVVEDITLKTDENTKLSLRLRPNSEGFCVPVPMFADFGDDTYVTVHSKTDSRRARWFLKSKTSKRDNFIVAEVSSRVPVEAKKAQNPDLLRSVAALVLEKSNQMRDTNVRLTNLSELLEAVHGDRLCWNVCTPDMCVEHPDVQALQKVSAITRNLGVPGDWVDSLYALSIPGRTSSVNPYDASDHTSRLVCSILEYVFEPPQ